MKSCTDMKRMAIAALKGLEKRISDCKLAQYKSDNRPMGWSETRYIAYWNMEYFKTIYQYEKIAERFEISK